MKTALKIAALASAAVLFAGCASDNQMDQLKASVQDARAAAIAANQNSQQALALAQQNAEKINSVFRKSQLK